MGGTRGKEKKMHIRWLLMGILLLTLVAAPSWAAAQEGTNPVKEAIPAAQETSTATKEATPTKKEATPRAKEQALPEVVVESERLVEKQDTVTIKAEGLPAKVNIVTKEDVQKTPMIDILDVLRNVPGVQIAKYPGGTPPAIGMRGFRSWRGSQVGVFIDGVPINQPQGAMVGEVDFSWLTQEMIERIEVIKGPFSALYGNFALAGVINIITKTSDPSPSLAAYGGTYNTGRAVGVYSDPSMKNIPVIPFMVWEGFTSDGYQDHAESRRGNLFNKITLPMGQGNLSMRLHYFSQFSMDPGLLPVDQVKSGVLSRQSSLDNTGFNDRDLFDLVLKYDPKGGEGGFHGTMFFNHQRSDRCYPSTRPPLQYRDIFTNNYLGWKLLYDFQPFKNFSLVAGNDLRYDQTIGTGTTTKNYFTLLSTYYSANVNQFGTGFFAQSQYKPFSFIKFVGGLRYDFFNINVDNRLNPGNSGTATPGIFSPKYGLVITPYKDINIFANRGQGFRTPYANELSPVTGTKNFSLDIPKLDTWDVGCNALLFDRLFFSFTYYNTRLQREMLWNANTNTYENIGTSKRIGFELEAKLFVTKELTLYGSFAPVRARVTNPTTAFAYYITNQNPDSSTLGFEYNKRWGKDHRLGVNFYWLRYSRTPVTTDGTIIAPQLDRFLSKLTYGYQKWTFSLDTTFTPRRYSSEYMPYVSTTGLWFVPYPKWELLAGLKYQF
jgi:outer membrane receptor protein involved in Fe transport